jgi:hypothetical protein
MRDSSVGQYPPEHVLVELNDQAFDVWQLGRLGLDPLRDLQQDGSTAGHGAGLPVHAARVRLVVGADRTSPDPPGNNDGPGDEGGS